jgi:hypothetical protein
MTVKEVAKMVWYIFVMIKLRRIFVSLEREQNFHIFLSDLEKHQI